MGEKSTSKASKLINMWPKQWSIQKLRVIFILSLKNACILSQLASNSWYHNTIIIHCHDNIHDYTHREEILQLNSSYFSSFSIFQLQPCTCGLALTGVRAGKYQQNQQLYLDYFFCEKFGIDPDNPCMLEVNGYMGQSLQIATYATYTFTPYIILIYILPVERLWGKVKLNMKKLID